MTVYKTVYMFSMQSNTELYATEDYNPGLFDANKIEGHTVYP